MLFKIFNIIIITISIIIIINLVHIYTNSNLAHFNKKSDPSKHTPIFFSIFSKIDKLGLDVISQEEFRAAVESRFDIEMTDDQFTAFIDRVPLDAEGNVRYADFMAQFDTRYGK